MAIMHPAIFLPQPPTATNPSKPSHPITVSTESAITSRETSEYFIPSLPMEIPSEIVMVLKITALPPAALAPWAALSASTLMCMLHGVTMDHVDAMPIWGFLKSSSLNPTARNMARLGARSSPSVTMEEYLRVLDIVLFPYKPWMLVFDLFLISADALAKLHGPADAVQTLEQAFLGKSIDGKRIFLCSRDDGLSRQICRDLRIRRGLDIDKNFIHFLGLQGRRQNAVLDAIV